MFLLIGKLQSGADLGCDFPFTVSCVVECLSCVFREHVNPEGNLEIEEYWKNYLSSQEHRSKVTCAM